MTRGFLPLLALVTAAGMTALGWATEGYHVVTSDGAWQRTVERDPRPVPAARLIDQDGIGFSLSDYRGKVVLVEFIYTSCPSLCGVLGDDFRRILDGLRRSDGVELLSVSFDPAHDGTDELRRYGERFGAVAPRWRIAAPRTEGGLAALLRCFGVVVIPDGFGGFVHNGAIYLVDQQGRLRRVLEPDSPAQIVDQALRATAS